MNNTDKHASKPCSDSTIPSKPALTTAVDGAAPTLNSLDDGWAEGVNLIRTFLLLPQAVLSLPSPPNQIISFLKVKVSYFSFHPTGCPHPVLHCICTGIVLAGQRMIVTPSSLPGSSPPS